MKRAFAVGIAAGLSACGPTVFEPSQPSGQAPAAAQVLTKPAQTVESADSVLESTKTFEASSQTPSQVASNAPKKAVEPPATPTETLPPVPTEPALHAEDGSLLPQTKEQPTGDTPRYHHHVDLLFKAIVKDDPEMAHSFFFPVEAYEKVKAIQKPARDWKNRLWRLFVRDIHAYHEKLGDNPEGAKWEGIEIREESIRWMKPHTEGNAIGYYRVTRSRIRGRKADGDSLDLELTAMISWRGEWYVVHLNGFR